MTKRWVGPLDRFIAHLEQQAKWNPNGPPCMSCGMAAAHLEDVRALLEDVRNHLRFQRRVSECACDVCGPVNGLIGRVDRLMGGE